jgi:hypothetical protein
MSSLSRRLQRSSRDIATEVRPTRNVCPLGEALATGLSRDRSRDTSRPGNSNAGHTYGTMLPPETKRALLEYLKTL